MLILTSTLSHYVIINMNWIIILYGLIYSLIKKFGSKYILNKIERSFIKKMNSNTNHKMFDNLLPIRLVPLNQ